MNSIALIITFLYVRIAFGKVTLSTLNAYGCFMCIATIWNSFKPHYKISKMTRLFVVLAMVAVSTIIAILGEHSFLNSFKAFILFLLTFFIPWSAINLVDYYLISKEECDIAALYDPNGKYRRWNSIGIGCYAVGVLLQLPFINSKFFTGAIATQLYGVDISWLVGILATAMIYYYFAKKAQVKNNASHLL
jgi:NCS1 family nucleobase:cation symporter-1